MCNCNKTATTTISQTEDSSNQKVKLISANPIKVFGTYTGRLYHFKKQFEIIQIDKRDAMYMQRHEGLLFLSQ